MGLRPVELDLQHGPGPRRSPAPLPPDPANSKSVRVRRTAPTAAVAGALLPRLDRRHCADGS
jgi:hypothetical protein